MTKFTTAENFPQNADIPGKIAGSCCCSVLTGIFSNSSMPSIVIPDIFSPASLTVLHLLAQLAPAGLLL